MGASDHPLFLGFALCILLGRGPSGVSGCQGAPAFVPARPTQPLGLRSWQWTVGIQGVPSGQP